MLWKKWDELGWKFHLGLNSPQEVRVWDPRSTGLRILLMVEGGGHW